MKATPIPERSRFLVTTRDRNRCVRCKVTAPNGAWHHRRRRGVRDAHTHCPCNGVWLCQTCHVWLHAHPVLAKGEGLILPESTREPWKHPFRTPLGWRLPDCVGDWEEAL